ncbi:hypothetical protein [Neomoorella thermoacetica]|uniref:hypothetical protein n=1 Tax=Neomoorella thermoacetica TaxID=1525 RepID=UPI0030CC4B9D
MANKARKSIGKLNHLIDRVRPMKDYGDYDKDLISPLLVALGVFIFANFAGLIFQTIAEQIYIALIQPSGLNILPPVIGETILKNSLLELIISPSELLQLLKSVFSISGLLFQNNAIVDIGNIYFPQLLIEIIGLINIFISWRYKTYVLSIITTISMALAYAQAEIQFAQYFFGIINAIFDNVLHAF